MVPENCARQLRKTTGVKRWPAGSVRNKWSMNVVGPVVDIHTTRNVEET